jgi:hypothetical protein
VGEDEGPEGIAGEGRKEQLQIDVSVAGRGGNKLEKE